MGAFFCCFGNGDSGPRVLSADELKHDPLYIWLASRFEDASPSLDRAVTKSHFQTILSDSLTFLKLSGGSVRTMLIEASDPSPYFSFDRLPWLRTALADLVTVSTDTKQLVLSPSKMFYKQIFDSVDHDNDGAISYSELSQAFEAAQLRFPVAKIQRIAQLLDVDGNGSIEFDNFLHLGSTMLNKLQQLQHNHQHPAAGRAVKGTSTGGGDSTSSFSAAAVTLSTVSSSSSSSSSSSTATVSTSTYVSTAAGAPLLPWSAEEGPAAAASASAMHQQPTSSNGFFIPPTVIPSSSSSVSASRPDEGKVSDQTPLIPHHPQPQQLVRSSSSEEEEAEQVDSAVATPVPALDPQPKMMRSTSSMN